MKLKHLVIACSVVLIGCSGDTTAPTPVGASGSVTFSYTGAGAVNATTYSAVGAVPTGVGVGTTTFGTTPWAVGAFNSTNTQLDVVGALPRTSTTWDLAIVSVARTTAGTSTIASCTGSAGCTIVEFELGIDITGTAFMFSCTVSSGSVTISTISSTATSGTFSGSGTCVTSIGTPSAFTVTNGSFSVGIASKLPGA